jgi:NADPH:quinone reductase-like Zn-dependent oxidoreductase
MKAVLWTAYGPPEVLQPGELPTPVPKPHQVRIRVRATAATFSDCLARGLAVPRMYAVIGRLILGWRRPKRKRVLGIVFSGEIDRVGGKVRSFQEGQQVFGLDPFGPGSYAEYKCMREKGALAPKPKSLTHREAAAIPYGGLLALGFLRAGGIETRHKVAVYGAAGAVGSSAVQLAKHFGAEVTGLCSGRNVELVKSLGADRVIDYTHEDFTALPDQYDLIFSAITPRFKPPSREQCRNILAPGGAYTSVVQRMPKMNQEMMALLKELVDAGKLKPVIDRSYELYQAAEAHRYIETVRKRGIVVMDVP